MKRRPEPNRTAATGGPDAQLILDFQEIDMLDLADLLEAVNEITVRATISWLWEDLHKKKEDSLRAETIRSTLNKLGNSYYTFADRHLGQVREDQGLEAIIARRTVQQRPAAWAAFDYQVDDEIFGTITRINADGSGREIIARGIRNTVGFDWHPETGELWFTDNGGDGLGDDFPGDELNRMTGAGQHFGFPHVHQGDTLDRRFGQGRTVDEFTPPAQVLGPHVAALGMRFYTGGMFPAEYKNQIFIAEHGSWNRSNKIGYRIMLVRLENGKAVSYEPFAEGWLQGGKNWGRPADLLFLPDGSMLVSDSIGNVLYRIAYEG